MVEGWWMQPALRRGVIAGTFLDDRPVQRMVTLLHNSQSSSRATIHVVLNETLSKDKTEMRLVFNTSLTVDVSANDDELRAAFIELITQSARTIYGPAAMLAKSRPILKITETSREGMVDIPLFDEVSPDVD
jgi:hypothetical protein